MKRTAYLVALLFGGLVTVFVACSNQGEGERCEVENGNDDCKTDEGLICYPAEQLNGTPNSDRCCPADRTRATHPVCQTPVSVVQDAQTPADTGPGTTTDAGSDADATADTDADASDGSDQ